ncbi:uncharacterized protein [Miscanthus floridulus]|uniref:uncharacterized protein n=1 Tax=Miscanthus floridulus TaxID=154761 RepID=UPI003459A544
MQDNESIPDMFHQLQIIVNDLKSLGEKVEDKDFSHKFLRCLPSRFDTLVTILVRDGLENMTPNQVLGDVVTQDTYHVERDGGIQEDEKKKKSVAFKVGSSSKSKGKAKNEESSEDEKESSMDEDEEMALFVRRFGKFMKKKGYGARKRRDKSKGKEEPRRCYTCTYNSDNDDDEKKDNKKEKKEKEKKMTFKKKKKGQSYCVTWDSDASSSDDDDDDSEVERKTTKKKAFASIAIQNKPSLFDAPSTCVMAKATKVQSYDESDSESEDEEEPSKEELFAMLEDAHSYMEKKRKEYKELRKKNQALEQSFGELKASYERLVEAHEELGNAHTKLNEAYSTLVSQDKKEHIQTCNVGITSDILDESFYEPIVVAPTHPSCSSSTTTSPMSDGFTCDASLMVENETLKKEVSELTHALGKAYGGEAHLLKCLGSQRFSLNKEGLGYTPKNGKAAFATHKTSFMKSKVGFILYASKMGT